VGELSEICVMKSGSEKSAAINKFCEKRDRTLIAVYAKLSEIKKKGQGIKNSVQHTSSVQIGLPKAKNGVIRLTIKEITITGSEMVIHY